MIDRQCGSVWAIFGLLYEGLRFYCRAGTNLSGQLHKTRHGIIEESLVSLAEIALPAKAFFVERSPILHAPTTTEGKVSAKKTFVTEILLGSGKGPLFAAGCQLLYRGLKNVAQSPPRLHKKITAEGIARVLNNNILTTLSIECANSMLSHKAI